MRGFEQHLSEFHRRSVEVVGVSVDSPAESRKLCLSRGYTFPLLSDPNADTIRQYGVLHPKGGEADRDIARPAEFLVDATGTVRWVNLTDDIRVRARPESALMAIDRL
ncbi:MAG: redoxin domain-containing protein [Acidobacteriaceae bacterium]|nr:redoxin domain-containing protein [Acidobacteriaceae bacterium]